MKSRSKPRSGEIISAKDAARLVAERVAELGSLPRAGERWGISKQMVHLVVRGERKLTNGMLRDLRLVPMPAEVRYRAR